MEEQQIASKNQATQQLENGNALAWVLNNKFVNENDFPIEFYNHRFLAQPYTDNSPEQTIMKSAQVGWSVLAVLRSIHLAAYRGMNVLYVLPTRNVVKDFVTPKVDPLINKNPAISKLVGSSSTNLKKFGDRFVYYRGAFSEREAISISGDLVIGDEFDRSDQSVLTTYASRLQASQFGWFWRFSNPTVPGFGVHALWQESDQMHWFVKCHHCNHYWFMEFETNEETHSHYVNQEEMFFACGKCHKELSDLDRQMGEWVPKYENREMRGYHISQLMAPWVTAKDVMKAYNEATVEFFHNFVLGLPYQAAELILNREVILGATTPTDVPLDNLVLGIDNGVEKHWCLGDVNGLIDYGKTTSWEEIERMIRHYKPFTVIDANPYPDIPKQLAKTYRGRVFIHYYSEDTKQLGITRWGEGDRQGVAYSDRTKIFDLVAGEINSRLIRFFKRPDEMEKFIYHAEQMYRVVEENAKGIKKGQWMTRENKPDHYLHALVYMRVAIEKLMSAQGSGIIRSAPPGAEEPKGVLIAKKRSGGTDATVDILEVARQTERKSRSWKNS